MSHVEQWYINYSMNHPEENFVKTVYLATDVPELIHEAIKKLAINKILTFFIIELNCVNSLCCFQMLTKCYIITFGYDIKYFKYLIKF